MKNWFKRFIALTMTGAIMAGSVTALAVDVNTTSYVASSEDDDPVTVYTDVNITKVENERDCVLVRSDISGYSNYFIRIYGSENGGEYQELKNVEYSGDDTFDGNREVRIKGLTNGQNYSFKLALVYGDEEVAYSEPVTFYRLKRAVLDRSKDVYLRNGKATVKWSRNSKADGYLIQCYKQGSKATTKKNFWVRNNKTRSKVLTGLSSKYSTVSIKAYKKVNGKTYYSYADTTGLITG